MKKTLIAATLLLTTGLSGAVIAAICDDWQGIDDIDMAIVPGGRSAVGQSVIEAVLSYAGQPVTVYRNGTLDVETGWRQGHEIDLPGLGRRRVALVETADAVLVTRREASQSVKSIVEALQAGGRADLL